MCLELKPEGDKRNFPEAVDRLAPDSMVTFWKVYLAEKDESTPAITYHSPHNHLMMLLGRPACSWQYSDRKRAKLTPSELRKGEVYRGIHACVSEEAAMELLKEIRTEKAVDAFTLILQLWVAQLDGRMDKMVKDGKKVGAKTPSDVGEGLFRLIVGSLNLVVVKIFTMKEDIVAYDRNGRDVVCTKVYILPETVTEVATAEPSHGVAHG